MKRLLTQRPQSLFFRRTGVLLLAFWLGMTVDALAAKFTVALDRDTIAMGESATLTLAFEGGSPTVTPQLPNIPKLRAEYSGQSSQFSFVNGATTSTINHSYVITPTEPGDIKIPAFQIVINGQTVSSQPVTLRVLKADQAQQDALSKLAFVRLIVPKSEYYVGEMFPVEFQLFVQDAQDLQPPQFATEGFTIGKQPQHTQSRVQVNGAVYNLLSFKMSIAAAKAGDLKLGPFECKLNLRIATQNNRRRDPFDPFEFFGGRRVELKPATLTSEAPVLKIKPLPQDNVPPGFSGTIGTFTFEMTAAPTNLTVGDPITLKIRIAGRGGLDGIALPSLDTWRDFKSYPPNSKVETGDPLGIEGAKTFEIVVVPQNVDVKEIPPLVFSYFDPELKSYRALAQRPIPLSVRPNAQPQQQPTINAGTTSENNAPATRDIVHIKLRPGTLGTVSAPLIQQPWFVGLQSIPLLCWIGAIAWRRKQEALTNNPRLRRARAVAATVAEGLAQLRQQAAANQSTEFFATVNRLLQEQIGERLDVAASAITESAVDELTARGADAATVAAVSEIFQVCNQARYAPLSGTQELNALATKVEAALGGLQKLNLEGVTR